MNIFGKRKPEDPDTSRKELEDVKQRVTKVERRLSVLEKQRQVIQREVGA